MNLYRIDSGVLGLVGPSVTRDSCPNDHFDVKIKMRSYGLQHSEYEYVCVLTPVANLDATSPLRQNSHVAFALYRCEIINDRNTTL